MNLKNFKLSIRDKLLLIGWALCSMILMWMAYALSTPIEHARTVFCNEPRGSIARTLNCNE